jgi:nucleotide-binding universal stress UspA family protein
MGPVVCCVDDSDRAVAAVRAARWLSEQLGLELVLLHVVDVPPAPGTSVVPHGREVLKEELKADGEALLDRIASELGGKVRRRVELGAVVPSILAALEDEGATLAVVGSHGRGGLRAALLGSVSTVIAGRAPCFVVVVPPAAAERREPVGAGGEQPAADR